MASEKIMTQLGAVGRDRRGGPPPRGAHRDKTRPRSGGDDARGGKSVKRAHHSTCRRAWHQSGRGEQNAYFFAK